MKILQINVTYKQGSTGKIVADLHTVLQSEGHNSVVCYGRSRQDKEQNVFKIGSDFAGRLNSLWTHFSGLPYSGAYTSTSKLISIIKDEQPDIVHVHVINGNFVNIARLLNFLKRQRIRTVITLHAEFMYTGGCGHAYECEKWKTGCGHCPHLRDATQAFFFDRTHEAWQRLSDAFEGFDNLALVAVSPWLADRARQSPFLAGKQIVVIENGVDTKQVFFPVDSRALRNKFGLLDTQVLLHVTAAFSTKLGHHKGGWFILELAKRLHNEPIKFLIVGNRHISEDLPDNVLNLGRTENQQELAAYYSLANLTILTSKRETYSMVCAESLCCGTPVVGFKAGGPETIALPEYSKFVEYGNLDELESAIRRWLQKKRSFGTSSLAEIAEQRYSKEKMFREYLSIYTDLLNTIPQ